MLRGNAGNLGQFEKESPRGGSQTRRESTVLSKRSTLLDLSGFGSFKRTDGKFGHFLGVEDSFSSNLTSSCRVLFFWSIIHGQLFVR